MPVSPIISSTYRSTNSVEVNNNVGSKRKSEVEKPSSKKLMIGNNNEGKSIRYSPRIKEKASELRSDELNSSFQAFNNIINESIIDKLSNDYLMSSSLANKENVSQNVSDRKALGCNGKEMLNRSVAGSSSSLSSEFNSQESQTLAMRLKRKIIQTPKRFNNGNQNGNLSKHEILQIYKNEHPPSLDNQDMGPFWGLPSRVQDLIEKFKGITELYEWQKKCLTEGTKDRNLLVSLPTSGGKTLVAEILMLRKLLLFKKDVILILPYVTLVQEKVRGLSLFAVDLNFLVEEYAGSKGIFPPPKRRKNVIYVATIEKASTLIDYLIEAKRTEKVGQVVVDEVHMIGETGGRGAKLEALLVKIKYVAKDVQIIGMSATVGNLSELAKFLDANLFCGSFRPVPLIEYVKVDGKIGEVDPKAKAEKELYRNFRNCTYPVSPHQQKLDPDSIANLVEEIIPTHSCLVFCPTKLNAEAVANVIISSLAKSHMRHKTEEKKSLLRALKAESDGEICPIFRKIIPYGISYHHSGLTEGERKLIEEGYLQGTLCCICCTSTLAAGVNLPARRVIIRAPYIGQEFLTRGRYQQMVGRAGRAGLDSKGESYLIVSRKDLPKVTNLLLSPVEKCVSRLQENNGLGLTELLFSLIWLGLVLTYEAAVECLKCSLLYLQERHLNVQMEDLIFQLMEAQKARGFLKVLNVPSETPDFFEDDNCQYGLSQLGKAAIKGSIDLTIAKTLYADLLSSRRHVALNCHMHLLYLVTPYSATGNLYFKEDVFCQMYEQLSDQEKDVARLLGITEAIIIKLSTGLQPKKVSKEVLCRFHATLAIDRVMKGDSVMSVSRQFKVHRGAIQQSMLAAASFASSVYIFCQELKELWAFQDLLLSFSKRVSAHCQAELVPLLELPSVKLGRARVLYKAGFTTLADVANADPTRLVESIDHLSYKVAYQIITSAKMLLLQKAEALQDEAAEMLLSLCES